MKKFICFIFVLIILSGCAEEQNTQLLNEDVTEKNIIATRERIQKLDASYREAQRKANLLSTENGALKSELLKYQTNPELIPSYKKVTFNDYTFQIPSSWTINKDVTPPKNESLYVEFSESDEVISRLRCPLLETGYEFEMSFYEHDSHHYIANDEIYNFEMSLMEAKNDDFRLGLILFRPIHHEPWEDSCQISGLADFDIYRNIYSSLTIEEPSSFEE